MKAVAVTRRLVLIRTAGPMLGADKRAVQRSMLPNNAAVGPASERRGTAPPYLR